MTMGLIYWMKCICVTYLLEGRYDNVTYLLEEMYVCDLSIGGKI